ncbi:rod-binding protein [Tabrizicola oligotrophica]|uniref:Chemotaxis protein chel n=1 Tax=Tabrizicola oligotrophica TaxID=2710650 RepID=A0A6M0QUM9_9RHOB|nr:rod-binding protein [Tabrizicola oligotrophica]NEY91129.1 chemotaxis protein chel [Tabrizicola oligotrophica]
MFSADPSPLSALPGAQGRDAQLLRKSQELEAAFLAEMLSFSGLSTPSESFGGGAGEEQFASFLRAEQARLMVARGGIGLAEVIFESMKSREGQRDGNP